MSNVTDATTLPQIEFFWRPGCPFCMLLERSLDQEGVVLTKRNIWEEPEAAAIVRSIAEGDETVPTVRIGEVALVNPSAEQVLAALAAAPSQPT
ncbi:MAG: glutaredoxin domain-containing protein [Actinomycetota bacterium]|nr:glutaredoxin domain-containing protein [Actinomycetota bacterium]